MKYQTAWIFTKKGNLLPWLYSKGRPINELSEKFYSKERELQLILLIRNDNGKIYCRIKCPVNPIPVKGEFEVPSISAISHFLFENEWRRKQVINASMFN